MEKQWSEARCSSFDGFFFSSKNSGLASLGCLSPILHRHWEDRGKGQGRERYRSYQPSSEKNAFYHNIALKGATFDSKLQTTL